MTVKIIGAGLAGCECAYYLANNGYKVKLYDIKPKNKTPAHKSGLFSELVCSNSLKSNDFLTNACGLLKEEMRQFSSLIISAADNTSVAAGHALAVDREKFAAYITEKIKNHKNIKVVCKEVKKVNKNKLTVVASGPLTTDALSKNLKALTGDNLYFFDASSPIITFESIDMNYAFFGDRYGKGTNDYINCPLTKAEYDIFVDELTTGEAIELAGFEPKKLFEGCMPVEEMAKKGKDTLRFGPLKPIGFTDPKTKKRPYAVIQLRKENNAQSAYNIVGFQTNLKFAEQKRIFGMIPALKYAEYGRYGVMHKNTYINSPLLLDKNFRMKNHKNVYFAGQISGVEGYVESAASGLLAAISIAHGDKLQIRDADAAANSPHSPFEKWSPAQAGRDLDRQTPQADGVAIRLNEQLFTDSTMLGALAQYIATPNKNFQPMNANYSLLKPLANPSNDKEINKLEFYKRSITEINEVKEKL